MSTFHAVIWMDHAEAHVLHLCSEHTETRRIKARAHHAHAKADGDDAHALPRYFDEIAAAIADAHEVLVTGPADAKLDFLKHLHAHRGTVANKVVGVETLDHPSDAQLAAHARKFFLRTDRMNGTPTPT